MSQGSVLGPLFFSIFAADSSSLDARLYIYANDVLLVKLFSPFAAITTSAILNYEY